MIRDWKAWEEFEQRLIASEPVDYRRNFRLADGLYELGRKLGRLPLADPLEGLEHDVQLSLRMKRVHGSPQANRRRI